MCSNTPDNENTKQKATKYSQHIMSMSVIQAPMEKKSDHLVLLFHGIDAHTFAF